MLKPYWFAKFLAPEGPASGAPAAPPASGTVPSAPAAPAPGAAPAPAPAASSAVLSVPPAVTVPSTEIPWLPGVDPVRAGYVQLKGWKDPADAIESYVNLEKLFGADKAGRTVVLPDPDAPKDIKDAFYNRLGRPADPAGYKIDIPAEIGDPEFAKAAAAKMHELGLPKAQGEALAAWFNERATAAVGTQKTQTEAQRVADDAALHREWGQAFQQNIAQAQTARRALGVDDATLDKLDSVLGVKGTLKLFQQIGAKSGEAEFITGSNQPGFKGILSPGQAQAKITEYRHDKNFVKRLTDHDAAATAEWKLLHEQAFPEPNQ